MSEVEGFHGISKAMSVVLRYGGYGLGHLIDPSGFVAVETLACKLKRSDEDIVHVARVSAKSHEPRFELSDDMKFVRSTRREKLHLQSAKPRANAGGRSEPCNNSVEATTLHEGSLLHSHPPQTVTAEAAEAATLSTEAAAQETALTSELESKLQSALESALKPPTMSTTALWLEDEDFHGLSRAMSIALRYGGNGLGYLINSDGFAPVNELAGELNRTAEDVLHVAQKSAKAHERRFEVSSDGMFVRSTRREKLHLRSRQQTSAAGVVNMQATQPLPQWPAQPPAAQLPELLPSPTPTVLPAQSDAVQLPKPAVSIPSTKQQDRVARSCSEVGKVYVF